MTHYNKLNEISMDLQGLSATLTVMESSDYYRENEDAMIMRNIRNSVDLIKAKLDEVMDVISEDSKRTSESCADPEEAANDTDA